MSELIGLIIFIVIFYYYYQNQQISQEQLKPVSYKDILIPSIVNSADNREFVELSKVENNSISKILLKIQLFYFYNEQAYEEMVTELENFLVLFRSINIDASYGGKFYGLMQDKKSLILNNLRSINIKIPEQYNLKDVLRDLETILDIYLKKAERLYKNYIHINGYDYQTKIINPNEMAYNKHNENIGSFSYY
jgi:hypothetical protein